MVKLIQLTAMADYRTFVPIPLLWGQTVQVILGILKVVSTDDGVIQVFRSKLHLTIVLFLVYWLILVSPEDSKSIFEPSLFARVSPILYILIDF